MALSKRINSIVLQTIKIPITVVSRAVKFLVSVLRGWLESSFKSLTGPKGYLIIPTLIAAWVGTYSIVEAMHSRSLNYSSFERSAFVTLVSSGSKASFIAAMKYFGETQTIEVRNQPDIFHPKTWVGTYQPNKLPMWRWCRQYLAQCTPALCGNGSDIRIDLSEAKMDWSMLIGVDFHNADLSKSWLIRADLTESNFNNANLDESQMLASLLVDATLQGASIRWTNLSEADFEDADAEGANFQGSILEKCNLSGANFQNTNLNGARLTDANLTGTDFTNANFEGADTTGAIIDDTILSGATWTDGTICSENSIGKCIPTSDQANSIDAQKPQG